MIMTVTMLTMLTMLMMREWWCVCAGYGGQWNEGSAFSNPDQLTLTYYFWQWWWRWWWRWWRWWRCCGGGKDDDDDYHGDCGGDGADDDQNCFMWRTMVSAPPLCVAPWVDRPPDIEPHQGSSSQSSICLIPVSQTLPRSHHNHHNQR